MGTATTTFRALGIACLCACACGLSQTPAAERLTIGSKAPPLDIEHWLTAKEPVTTFTKGHVYIIEFWATWCGPCISSMPHLRDLQVRHAPDITVIGVSDESEETIEKFLEREQNGSTLREITSHYRLATDPDGSVKKDYMRAAEQGGIPTAFIVGKTGEIEWIGHPMQIDTPLARILDDSWNRDAFARQLVEEQEVRGTVRLAFDHARHKRYPEALAAIDSIRADIASPEVRRRIQVARKQIEELARSGERGGQEGFGERGQINVQHLAIGDRVTIPVTGRDSGAVWGDALYTLDSDLGTAAVHAGLVRVGETKTLRVWVVPSPGSFGESSRNGIQSRRWGPFPAAFIMQAADSSAGIVNRSNIPRRNPNVIARLEIGESLTLSVTGVDKGPLWGTNEYTGDSLIDAAAVHAGAVQVGERAEVIVTRVEAPARFEGSSQNGVRSNSWGSYPTAFKVKRMPGGRP